MRAFDPGYGSEPFATLCRDYPGDETYPADAFRVEWGPVFHRGRLDGSDRLLVIGQDPGVRTLLGGGGDRLRAPRPPGLPRLARDPRGTGPPARLRHLTHPTRPEAVSRGDRSHYADAMRAMLVNWSKGLDTLFPAIGGCDTPVDLVPYGDTLRPEDLTAIPEQDLPAGLPAWMGAPDAFAARSGDTPEKKRATIVITVPRGARPWL